MQSILLIVGLVFFLLIAYLGFISKDYANTFVSLAIFFATMVGILFPNSALNQFFIKNRGPSPRLNQDLREYWIYIATLWMILVILGIFTIMYIDSRFEDFPPPAFGVVAYIISPLFTLACFIKAVESMIYALMRKNLHSKD